MKNESIFFNNLNTKEKQLLEEFQQIGYLDSKEIKKALSKFKTAPQKLNYLKDIKERYTNKFYDLVNNLSIEEYEFYALNKSAIQKLVFSKKDFSHEYPLLGEYSREIPFTPIFTFWFLEYYANINLIKWLNNPKNIEKFIKSDIRIKNITLKLKTLKEEEERALKLREENEDIIYQTPIIGYESNYEKAVLRVLDGNYFKNNIITPSVGLGTSEVKAYFKHKLLKKYLKKLLDKENSFNNTVEDNELNQDSNHFNFKNNLDNVLESEVYDYFRNNLVNKGYLLIQDLESYLVSSFDKKEKPNQLLSFSNLHIGNITNVFYKYYRDIAKKPHGRQNEYAGLLGEYFNGFTTKKVMSNFAKNYQRVRN